MHVGQDCVFPELSGVGDETEEDDEDVETVLGRFTPHSSHFSWPEAEEGGLEKEQMGQIHEVDWSAKGDKGEVAVSL